VRYQAIQDERRLWRETETGEGRERKRERERSYYGVVFQSSLCDMYVGGGADCTLLYTMLGSEIRTSERKGGINMTRGGGTTSTSEGRPTVPGPGCTKRSGRYHLGVSVTVHLVADEDALAEGTAVAYSPFFFLVAVVNGGGVGAEDGTKCWSECIAGDRDIGGT
jgi:hypothetical protein